MTSKPGPLTAMEGARPRASLRPGPRARVLGFLIACTVAVTLLAGCRADSAASAPTEEGSRPGQAGVVFRSANGLLYPPELWSAVGPSREALVLRALAGAQLAGAVDRAAWTAKETSALLAEEASPLEAAWLMAQGAPERTPSADALTGWWRQSLATREWLMVWMADDLQAASGAPLTLSPDDRRRLRAARAGVDVLGQHVAAVVLARRDGSTNVVLPELAARAQIGTPREAALVLMLRADAGESPDVRNAGLVPSLVQAARTDDWVLYYLTRAYAASGDEARARSVVEGFDSRRVLPDGTVLEVPSFTGSVGSTFRMVRYHADRGDLDDVLGPGGRAALASTVSAERGVDLLHALAVTATLTLLDPASVPATQRTEVVTDAASALIPGEGAMTLEQAVAWTQLAEYARAMDVPMPYRGLAADAVQRWVDADPAVAAPTLSLFLRARGSDSKGDPQVRQLLPVVRAALTEQPPAQTDSSILVTGSLALHEIEGGWLVPPSELAATVAARWGGCRGGFDGYLRGTAVESAVCNVDDSWAALSLARQLGGTGAP